MKLLLAVTVLGCLVVCSLQDEYGCGPFETYKIKRQWLRAHGTGRQQLEFNIRAFNKYFHAHPEGREDFSKFRSDNVYSPQFQALMQVFMSDMDVIVHTADDKEALDAIYGMINKIHTKYDLKPAFYKDFPVTLRETLGEVLGIRFDWDAWSKCMMKIVSNFPVPA